MKQVNGVKYSYGSCPISVATLCMSLAMPWTYTQFRGALQQRAAALHEVAEYEEMDGNPVPRRHHTAKAR